MDIKKLLIVFCMSASLCFMQKAQAEEKTSAFRICATTPDLANIAKSIGGDYVNVTSFTKGTEDPHFIVAKPSFVKNLSQADLLIFNGLELEAGWLPLLIKGSRNANVKEGADGSLNSSMSIHVLEIPNEKMDRSHGHVHMTGNPHYLIDPINGLKVARAIKTRLAKMNPKEKEYFENKFNAFGKELSKKMIGEKLTSKYSLEDLEKIALLFEHNKLTGYLKEQKEFDLLGGWFKDLAHFRGTKILADHNLWPYFAKRFGLNIVGYIEPKPGVSPSTKHLGKLVKDIEEKEIELLIQSSSFNTKYGEFLSKKTNIKTVAMAEQVGSREGVDGYLSMIEHNLKIISEIVKK